MNFELEKCSTFFLFLSSFRRCSINYILEKINYVNVNKWLNIVLPWAYALDVAVVVAAGSAVLMVAVMAGVFGDVAVAVFDLSSVK